jgi:hypothetical protein
LYKFKGDVEMNKRKSFFNFMRSVLKRLSMLGIIFFGAAILEAPANADSFDHFDENIDEEPSVVCLVTCQSKDSPIPNSTIHRPGCPSGCLNLPLCIDGSTPISCQERQIQDDFILEFD